MLATCSAHHILLHLFTLIIFKVTEKVYLRKIKIVMEELKCYT